MDEFNPNLGIIKDSQKYEQIIKDNLFNKYITLNLYFKEIIIISLIIILMNIYF